MKATTKLIAVALFEFLQENNLRSSLAISTLNHNFRISSMYLHNFINQSTSKRNQFKLLLFELSK